MCIRDRYDGSSYKGYNDYYLVVVFGYHVVNGDKINTPFYLRDVYKRQLKALKEDSTEIYARSGDIESNHITLTVNAPRRLTAITADGIPSPVRKNTTLDLSAAKVTTLDQCEMCIRDSFRVAAVFGMYLVILPLVISFASLLS